MGAYGTVVNEGANRGMDLPTLVSHSNFRMSLDGMGETLGNRIEGYERKHHKKPGGSSTATSHGHL